MITTVTVPGSVAARQRILNSQFLILNCDARSASTVGRCGVAVRPLRAPARVASAHLRRGGLERACGPAAARCAARLAIAAFGVAAGLALWRRRSSAVTLAKASLLLSAGADIFVYATPYFPNNRPPGDTQWFLAGSLAYHAAWIGYLLRSTRVRNTY